MYEYSCKITKVVDGDTVDAIIDLGFDILYKSRIRLFGIDTPESRTKNLDEKARGLLSKNFIKDHLSKNAVVTIKTYKDSKGKFGRILGELHIDGVNINQLMIQKRLAVEYYGQSKIDIENKHLENRQWLIDNNIYIPLDP